MKKIILLFLMLFVSSQVYAEEKIEVFKVNNEPIEFGGFLLLDDTIYIDLGYTQEERSRIFKFENKKFYEIEMTQEQVINFVKEYEIERIDNPDVKKKGLGHNKYLLLKRNGDSYTDYFMSIEENGKEKDISKNRYVLSAFGSYAYIDKTYQKLYLFCIDNKKKVKGLFIYDINNDTFKEFLVKKEGDKKAITFSNPIRIPNTEFLLFFGAKNEKNWGLYIEEIPEWKTEIEAKEKAGNKSTEEVKAEDNKSAGIKERYIIDGPANIRDNYKKGKTIATIENDEEITIIDKKGSWYQISYKDIIGWTFKDNIKKVN